MASGKLRRVVKRIERGGGYAGVAAYFTSGTVGGEFAIVAANSAIIDRILNRMVMAWDERKAQKVIIVADED